MVIWNEGYKLKTVRMKWFWKYAFPLVFGLLIYFSIRVVTDTNDGTKFWLRPIKQNAIEIVCVVFITCLTLPVLNRLVQKFSTKTKVFNVPDVLKEYGIILLVALLSMNPMLYFIHYLIEDPVTLSDLSVANVVVALYILLYYSIARGNKFIQAYIDQQLKLERLTNDQLQTELKFLKAQYHPHSCSMHSTRSIFRWMKTCPAPNEASNSSVVCFAINCMISNKQ